MLRTILPSEATTIGLSSRQLEDWMTEEDAERSADIRDERVTLEIQRICHSIADLSAAQRERIGKMLKMPLAPMALLSTAAGIAAVLGWIPEASAAVIAGASGCYSIMKGYGFTQEMLDDRAMRELELQDARRLLAHVPERDILMVRSMLDELPELRDAYHNI